LKNAKKQKDRLGGKELFPILSLK